MLEIVIPYQELWDETKLEFINTKECVLELEHSLLSLSKWESKWHKPFLGKDEPSFNETIDYIRCMTLNRKVDPDIYNFLTKENIAEIRDYISNPMTATTFSDQKKKGINGEVITAELIYYWMVALNIPFECQKWHLNKLITLIRVCNIKNEPPKKRSQNEIMSRNAALNAARKKQLNTKG